MTHKSKKKKNRNREERGIETITGQGYDSLYIRGRWMEKLDRLERKKKKEPKYLRKQYYD